MEDEVPVAVAEGFDLGELGIDLDASLLAPDPPRGIIRMLETREIVVR
jgi:hypothetical protein